MEIITDVFVAEILNEKNTKESSKGIPGSLIIFVWNSKCINILYRIVIHIRYLIYYLF